MDTPRQQALRRKALDKAVRRARSRLRDEITAEIRDGDALAAIRQARKKLKSKRNHGLNALLARRLGVSPQALNAWLSRGRIPMRYVEALATLADMMPNEVDPLVPTVIIEDAPPGDDAESPAPAKPSRRQDGMPSWLDSAVTGGEEE